MMAKHAQASRRTESNSHAQRWWATFNGTRQKLIAIASVRKAYAFQLTDGRRCGDWCDWRWWHSWLRHRHHICGSRCVYSIMCAETHCRRKYFVAFATLVRLGRRRRHQMQLLLVGDHITIPRKRLAADVAVMVLDAGVGDHVPRKIARC